MVREEVGRAVETRGAGKLQAWKYSWVIMEKRSMGATSRSWIGGTMRTPMCTIVGDDAWCYEVLKEGFWDWIEEDDRVILRGVYSG